MRNGKGERNGTFRKRSCKCKSLEAKGNTISWRISTESTWRDLGSGQGQRRVQRLGTTGRNEAGEVSWPDDELIWRAIDKVC